MSEETTTPAPPVVTVDLTNCDREPIHVPGSIQPFGVLLALAAPGLAVQQVSANAADLLGVAPEALLGRPVADLLDDASLATLRACLDGLRDAEVHPLRVTAKDRAFDGLLHRHEGAILLELEPFDPTQPEPSAHALLCGALAKIQAAPSLDALVDVLTREVRRLTGFDRVMVYQFNEAGHGEVIAEARSEGIDAYLGLRYPASDIPRQARRLYTINWLRIIPDAGYRPVPLVPTLRPDTGQPLDLSFSILRSVSPIHVEYLHNMGIRAAMSVSLVHRGALWGLLTCGHHGGPRRVPYALRAACEVIGRVASLQIAAMTEIEERRCRDGRQATLAALVEAMRSEGDDVLVGLAARERALLEVVSAGGAAIWSAEGCAVVGRAPPRAAIERLAAWLEATSSASVFHTASLPRASPEAEDVADVASGLLALRLPRPGYVLWFRPEIVQTVRWGGDPSKPVEVEPDGAARLHPRRSFALWKEIVRQSSLPWKAGEIEAAEDLRRHAIEIDLERQIERARQAVRARDDIVAVVSHDLRNPVGVIQMAGAVIARSTRASDTDPDSQRVTTAVDRIQRAAARMSSLIDDLLDVAKIESGRFMVAPRIEDAQALVDESIGILRPLAEQKGIRIPPIAAPPGLRARMDRERIFQVFSNLIGNAIKFTPEGGTITVGAERRGEEVLFFVRDTGPGIPDEQRALIFDRYWQAKRAGKSGVGLGLSIVKGIVEAHGGRVWVGSEVGCGTTFYFTLPAA